MNENIIRENLFKTLNQHFPNLTPIDQEVYLKIDNQRSFIDILAHDEKNNYVIIELKRTNQASRQALHEVFKYTEFVKKNYAVNDEHIKVMIVSTEWRELLIPYSKFVSNNTFLDIKGIHLFVDSNGNCIRHNEIKPLEIKDELVFSPKHLCTFHNDQASLEKAIKSYESIMQKKRIIDYVLIILHNTEETIPSEHSFEYVLYFSMLRKTESEYENILKIINDEETTNLAHSNGTKGVLFSYEKAIILHEFPYNDEINWNAKPLYLDSLIYKELWQVIEIKKYGKMENNILFDEIILKEVLQYNGSGNTIFEDNIFLHEKNKVNKLREKSKLILDNNEMFKNQFTIIIEDILDNYSQNTKVEIIIYNTTNILLSLFQEIEYCKGKDHLTSLPFFRILVADYEYYGTLIWEKSKEYDYKEIYNMTYSDNIDFFKKTQTSHILENDEILEYLDLEYNTIKKYNGKYEYFHNGKFKKKTNIKTIVNFMDSEIEFVNELAINFKKKINGGVYFV